MPKPYDGVYGVLNRATFTAQYVLLMDTKAIRIALQHGRHVVLVEEAEGQPECVNLLPADATPYAWRTVWCHKEQS